MLKCKICQLNDTDSTTGMCWECMNKKYAKSIKKSKISDYNFWKAIQYLWKQLDQIKDIGEDIKEYRNKLERLRNSNILF